MSRPIIKILLGVLGASIGGALGWLALRGTDWEQVIDAVHALDWRILVLAVGAMIFAMFLQAYRWKLLLPDEKVSVRRLFLVLNVGQGLNNISPVRVFGEITEAAMLARGNGIRVPKVVSSILMARIFDLLITVNLVGVGLIVLPELSGFKPIVAPLWGMTAVALLALLLLGRRMHRLPAVRRLPLLAETLRSLGTVRTQPKVFAKCIVLTTGAWMSIGAAAWLVAQGAGVNLPFWLMSIVIVAVGFFASTIPAPPGTVGVYEFGVVSTLGLFAIDPSVALTFALVIHGVLFFPPLLIGIPMLARERHIVGGVLGVTRMTVQWTRKRLHSLYEMPDLLRTATQDRRKVRAR